ncbi:1547_t:CDS:2, partial [Paraglomus occultum]
HGQRSDWLLKPGETLTYPTGLTYDTTLTDHGRNQARELAAYLVTNNIKLDRLYSSPFYRTMETANVVAETLDLQILVENGLGEWFNVGCKRAPASLVQLHSYFPRVHLPYNPIRIPSPNGETLQDLRDRLSSVMNEMISQCDEAGNVKTIMTVGHAASVIEGVRTVIGDRYASVNCGTCTLTVAKRIEGEWKLITNGDASFLSKGEENKWAFTEVRVLE